MSSQVIREMTHDPLVKERIYLPRDVSDNQVEWYFRNCVGTIFPSLYEGWGLPVAESLARGRICLASNASSIPEISELPEFFDPHNPVGLSKLIMRTLHDTEWREEVEDRIQSKFRVTRWNDTAKEVLNTLEMAFDWP